MSCDARVFVSAVATALTLCVGCAPGAPSTAPSSTDNPTEEFDTTVAGTVISNLEKDDHINLHPVDTTSADCPAVGCAQSVTTDKFRIMSFKTTGAAQRYAGTHGLRQLEALVVDFPPTVPAPERDALWSRITRMVR
jgi:hypothetical protein